MSETSKRVLALDAENEPATGVTWNSIVTLAREVEALEADVASLKAYNEQLFRERNALEEVRQHGCDCSDDDACLFARQRDAALAESERFRRDMVVLRNIAIGGDGDVTTEEAVNLLAAMRAAEAGKEGT